MARGISDRARNKELRHTSEEVATVYGLETFYRVDFYSLQNFNMHQKDQG
jgi:hypothetical protein